MDIGNPPEISFRPLVSIGMSVRDNERTLGLALRSILAQTYPHWELLLVDDGSSDGTLDVARQFAEADERIKIVHVETEKQAKMRRLPECLNRTLDHSRGEFF